jgi:RimJ/RimL family protein N-acetyltransferase
MPGPEIRTERLILRRWRVEDVDPYAAICAEPEVMQWIGGGQTRNRQECAEAIGRFEASWARKGYGLFAMTLKGTDRFIGFTGVAEPEFLPEVMPAVEIGWRLARDHWGQGLATEAARAALQFALNDIGLTRVISIIQAGNAKSERIASKLSMTVERETTDPTCGRCVRVYETGPISHSRGSPGT